MIGIQFVLLWLLSGSKHCQLWPWKPKYELLMSTSCQKIYPGFTLNKVTWLRPWKNGCVHAVTINVWEIHRGIYKACMLECQILNGKFWECCIIYAIRTEIYSQCALLNNLRWSLLHRQWLYVKGLPLILLLYNMICRISFLNFSLLHSQPFMHPLVYIKSILLLCTVFRKKTTAFNI